MGNVGKAAPKYSLTSRRPDTTPGAGRHSPGPGNYNPNDTHSKKQAAKWGFGSSIRKDSKRDNSPSPDSYNVSALDSKKKTSPSFGFGSSNRPPLSARTFSPGPGNYNSPTRLIEKSGYYMGSRIQSKKKDDLPGPGNYNPEDKYCKTKNPDCKIGTSPRGESTKYKASIPGPGNYQYYNPAFDKGPYVKIGSEQRGKKLKSDTPGPGSYKIPVKIMDVPRYLIPNQDEKYKFV